MRRQVEPHHGKFLWLTIPRPVKSQDTLSERSQSSTSEEPFPEKTENASREQPCLNNFGYKAGDLSENVVLYWLASHGHVNDLSRLLDNGVNPSVGDARSRTALWWAVRNNQVAVVRRLLGHKDIDLQIADESGRTTLMCAAERGNVTVLRLLLQGKSEAFVNIEDPQGRTALSWAAGSGMTDTTACLLESGADTEVEDIHGRTPLLWAAAQGHESIADMLLSNGADVESSDLEGRTAFSWIAEKGDGWFAALLLGRSEVAPYNSDKNGRTPLIWASMNGHVNILRRLFLWAKFTEAKTNTRRYRQAVENHGLKAKRYEALVLERCGIDIDAADIEGRTPLSWAASRGHLEFVKELLEMGSDVELEDVNGRTPFWWAAANGHLDVIKMLLDRRKVDPRREDRNGDTALSRAAYAGHDDVVSFLEGTRPGKTTPLTDPDQEVLLLWAAKRGDESMVKLLLQLGAKPNPAESEVGPPLVWAAFGGMYDIARLLVDAGADIEAEAKLEDKYTSGTSLWWAASKGHIDMVAYLLDKGANIEWGKKYSENITPLAEAARNGHAGVVELLLHHGADLRFKGEMSDDAWKSYQRPHNPMAVAVTNGHIEIAKILIDHGIRVLDGRPYEKYERTLSHWKTTDYPDTFSRTLLSWAAEIGHAVAVRQLISLPHVDINFSEARDSRPLSWAAQKGHVAIVDLLLENGAEVAYTQMSSFEWEIGYYEVGPATPFTLAFKAGHQDLTIRLFENSVQSGQLSPRLLLPWASRMGLQSIVTELLAKGHEPLDFSEPLEWAAMAGQEEIVNYLLDQGAPISPQKTGEYHPGPLSGAAMRGQEAIVRILLARGADPNSEECADTRMLPLSRAALNGHLVVAELLLDHGADPNKLRPDKGLFSKDSRPPLAIAAYYGYSAMVSLLLARGADPVWESTGHNGYFDDYNSREQLKSWQVPEPRSYEGKKSALSYAIDGYATDSDREDVVKILVQAGADGKNKDLPLIWAVQAKKTNIARLLLDHGAGFELKDYGETALTVAARRGNASAVELFIERGANIEAKDKDGRSPLSHAKTLEVARLLINAGANVNSEDKNGKSPLSWTANLETIQLLLDNGAKLEAEDDKGLTALSWAAWEGVTAVVQLLLERGASPETYVGQKPSPRYHSGWGTYSELDSDEDYW